MRTVTLKCSGYRWTLAPGAVMRKTGPVVLAVRDVPDNVTDADCAHVADRTLINMPVHHASEVEFGRLGPGRIVNLVTP